MANRQIDICLSKWYTVKGSFALHESVGETGWWLESLLAFIGSARPDRQYIAGEQFVYISGPHIGGKEFKAYFYRHRQVYLVFPFLCFL